MSSAVKPAKRKTKKPHPAWTPEARAKRLANIKLRQEAKAKTPSGVMDAIVFLEHAEKAIIEQVHKGNKKAFTKSDTYALLALKALKGES